MKTIYILAIFMLPAIFCSATVRLPAVIASNMVLQQQTKAALWGWCDPGERITITTSWNNKLDSAKGTRDGKWRLDVPTPAAGGPYTIVIKGRNTITLENVLIGEVWVCSGQSNMEMSLEWAKGKDILEELPVGAAGNIHLFHITRSTSQWPQENCDATWTLADSTNMKSFSAVAWYFGKKLNQTLHVPIGLIEAAWGGTPAEVWTPTELVTGDSALKPAAARLTPSDWWPYMPGYCYNAMIAPITSYPIAGAIWYQGESNTTVPRLYGQLFSTMIGAWRQAWKKELPFYYVQIAPYKYGVPNQASYLREQQTKVMRLDNTGMVVVSDITGDTADIHPKNKHDVGQRLAGWALAETYHRSDMLYKNPQYGTMEIKGSAVIINILYAPTGLVTQGGPVRTIEIAGADKVFYPADTRIDGSRLTVSSKQVKVPVAVRYQFSNAGVGNVFSRGGLPLAPFRTDDWE